MTETYFIREKKEKDFTVISNVFLRDKTLSWKAKGLFAYMLSLPEDWKIHLCELEKHATDGKDSLRSAINELIEKGYIIKEMKKENGKFDGYVYTIIERPDHRVGKTATENPHTENPHTENPHTENPQLLNTNKLNTNKLNTNKLNTNIINDKTKKRFMKPTVEEIKNYCEERKNNIDAEHFFDFYESKDWKIGKNKMKDWKACVRTWERNQKGNVGFQKRGGAFDVACNHIDSQHDYSKDAGVVLENGEIGF